MSVKKFKFVSPGVFINEIDNSFIPRRPDTIGPTVIGRATRGLAMQPQTVDAYSDFVSMFGETVPGNAGGDVYRSARDIQSPIYSIYAAKGFLNAGVAPLTYVRALGQQSPTAENGTAPNFASQAGWRTLNLVAGDNNEGGAYGLIMFQSAALVPSGNNDHTLTGALAAVWYLESGMMMLSGNAAGSGSTTTRCNYKQPATLIESDANGNFKAVIQTGQSALDEHVFEFNMADTSTKYARQVFNTNPQLFISGNFYPTAPNGADMYWLGETYDQHIRDIFSGNLSQNFYGAVVPISLKGTATSTPANRLGSNAQAREAVAGWFISQDTGDAAAFNPLTSTVKLFRLIGRGHGAWLSRNVKISISNIRQSNSSTTDYGTFSVLVRSMSDTDNAMQILERFDECTLDPTSPNYVGRKIGDQYLSWDEDERRYKRYGQYPNQSKYVYVDVNPDVAAGATGMETLLPFGYYDMPKYKDVPLIFAAGTALITSGGVVTAPADGSAYVRPLSSSNPVVAQPSTLQFAGVQTLSRSAVAGVAQEATMTRLNIQMPRPLLRHSASDGGISDPRNAFFGFMTGRNSGSMRYDASVGALTEMLNNNFTALADNSTLALNGIDGFNTVFTLDDLVEGAGSSGGLMFYASGSRAGDIPGLAARRSYTSANGYQALLNKGFNSFTAPLWGGFDGFDVHLPDPLYNNQMTAASNNENSSAYYTIKKAIDSVADPEVVETNLITMPGLTQTGLTRHIVEVCERRADAMSLIDLPDVYLPTHEGSYSTKKTLASRIATTPQAAATALRDRQIDSSYGATFYPWVQTRDENTGAAVWLPPSAAMLGVLASSEKKAQLWFAPAGFNRGGLTEGAAGIPVSAVTEKLTSKERDLLYEANINPIASFPSTGIVVFGQKTLQERQSALDRINVRRLVIFLKKEISRISTKILFEQNVQTTWNRFTGLVEPFLANVKSNFGISDYKLVLDESTTTPDLIDQNIMYAKIMVKPARSIEYIAIDFVVASTGASFDD
jgi:hypothetical protein